MSFLYQLGREGLRDSVYRNSSFLTGKCLDVGSHGKQSRYREYLHVDEYISLDIDSSSKPDIVANVENIPAPDGNFDGILCYQMLDDVRYPEKALNEFHRVLKKGGYILLAVPLVYLFSDDDFWRFSPKGLRLLLKEAGFQVVKEERLGGLFAVRNQLLFKHIKNKFALHKRGSFIRGVCNKLFILYGMVCKALDRIFPSEECAINLVIVAKAQ